MPRATNQFNPSELRLLAVALNSSRQLHYTDAQRQMLPNVARKLSDLLCEASGAPSYTDAEHTSSTAPAPAPKQKRPKKPNRPKVGFNLGPGSEGYEQRQQLFREADETLAVLRGELRKPAPDEQPPQDDTETGPEDSDAVGGP
ncbi:hypothetical protein D0N36_06755 [Hymenobacter lapidiphilus]|nr:hypothetical protein D0N36_06755 [Hymenobacter sp. CCM 8763]